MFHLGGDTEPTLCLFVAVYLNTLLGSREILSRVVRDSLYVPVLFPEL